jgi:uncharacterized Zn finger protein
MAHKFGRTWWGLQWLNALERIDYSNRLPRGRNYASKGAVKNIEYKLPASLLKLARKRNIQIFPTSWRDIEMTCSCPDWAVPCKHIAAVVYTIATNIDENPFLVFELHGFDMIKNLKNKNINIEGLKQEKIISLPELFYDGPPALTAEDTGQQEVPDFTQLPAKAPSKSASTKCLKQKRTDQ